MGHVTLIGAEAVERAGRNIAGAADQVERTLGSMSYFAEQMNRLGSQLEAATHAMEALANEIKRYNDRQSKSNDFLGGIS